MARTHEQIATEFRREIFEGVLFDGFRLLLEAQKELEPDDWIDLVHEAACDALFSDRSPALALVLTEELVRRVPESSAYAELHDRAERWLRGDRSKPPNPPRLDELIKKTTSGKSLTPDELREVMTLLIPKDRAK